MKILVTGYKGFIGQNIVKDLANDHDIRLFEWGEDLPDVQGLDWVLHIGAISSTTERDVEKVLAQNYDFSVWLLKECIRNSVNFQYSSSASVYGLGRNFNEDAPKNPLSPYAWSKYLFDRYVKTLNVSNIRIQGFRYFNVYGPGEDHKGNQASPYFKFEKQARETGEITLFEGSDNFLRDFVHVSEVCRTHREFFDVEESGIFNVGTGATTSFETVARTIADKFGAKIKYVPMPEELKSQYQIYTCADMEKTRNALNEKNLRKRNV